MRKLIHAVLILTAVAAHAQLVNGDFEQAKPATAPPNAAWTLKTGMLPEAWSYNGQYGGPVGLVADAHTGKQALTFSASGTTAHVIGQLIPVKTGDVLELSGWAKGGTLGLTFYEVGENNKWLRTVPAVTRIEAPGTWTEGGGYHVVSDPTVTAVNVVLDTDHAGVTVDDVVLRKVSASAAAGPDITLETQNCRLVLTAGGACRSFYDKTLQEERLTGQARPFMSAKIGAWTLPITALKQQGNTLLATFGDKAEATLDYQACPYWIGLTLKSSRPQLSAINLVDVNLKALGNIGNTFGGDYNDKSTVGVWALDYSGIGQVRAFAAGIVNVQCTFGKYGTDKAACALFSCPRPLLDKTIQDMETQYNIRSPRLNGVWPKGSPLMRRSYFFVTDLSEANVDEVIRYGKRGHFGYILILEGSWSKGGGTFAINERNFPNGMDGLKATVAKLKKAGFKVGLHVLCAGMRGSDPLVSPVPDDGIYVDTQVPLAAAVDEKADFIPTSEPPTKFATASGYNENGTYARIGDEIISYGALKLDPPYGLLRCQRGALSSKPAAHKAGDAAKHLYMSYGLFLIDANSDLMGRVADNAARAVNYCDIDGFYFDGAERLQGDHYYYNAKIQDAYYSRFKKRDMILQGSSFSHFSWHWICRMASADGFAHIKEYLDKRTPSFSWYFNNFMPLDIGWYAVNPNIRPDDIEYVCSRSVGFESSISIETGVSNLNSVPQAPQIIDMIARWEDLRLSGRVPAAIREKLREPGKEYHLETIAGKDSLTPVEYSGWAVCPEGTVTAAGKNAGDIETVPAPQVLAVENKRSAPAKVQLQLECAQPIKPGEQYETGQPLELFEGELAPVANAPLGTNMYDPAVHGSRATRDGVTQELALVTDDVKEGKSALRFTATSTLKSVGGWATFGRAFPEPVAMKDYNFIGLWVKGDGKGEWLKVQLWDTKGKPQDQYVTINFTGWRFIELPRPKPDVIDTSNLRSINFYFNNIPGETTCSIILDGVKVLSRATTFDNPVVNINGKSLKFRLTMNPGDRLLYEGGKTCTAYAVGAEPRSAAVEGGPDALPQKFEASAVDPTHQVRLRAALLWPSLALTIPAK